MQWSNGKVSENSKLMLQVYCSTEPLLIQYSVSYWWLPNMLQYHWCYKSWHFRDCEVLLVPYRQHYRPVKRKDL